MPVTEIDYKNAYLELLPKYQQLQKEFDQFHISYA